MNKKRFSFPERLRSPCAKLFEQYKKIRCTHIIVTSFIATHRIANQLEWYL